MQLLLADDHPIFRKGLKSLILDHFKHFSIVEVDNGADAIDQLEKGDFTIAILDIDMPKKSGIEVLKFLKQKDIDTKSVVLTMHNDELFFNESFNQGALGFLLKEDSSLEIVECLESIMAGTPFVSTKMAPLLKNRKSFTSKMNAIKNSINSLSNSEYNTLRLVTLNKTSKEIAELLFVTEKSVENYRSRICKKLNLTGGSNTLYKWCVENKDIIIQNQPAQ